MRITIRSLRILPTIEHSKFKEASRKKVCLRCWIIQIHLMVCNLKIHRWY